MVQKTNQIRTAFILPEDHRWTGGINYLKNLLYAINCVDDNYVRPILYVGKKTEKNIINKFAELAEIRISSLFDRGCPLWVVRRSLARLIGRDVLCVNLFRRHQIDLASHCNLTADKLPFKSINWIPDFQHIHLSSLFSRAELNKRNRKFKQWINCCNLLVLSSHDSGKDCITFLPESASKIRVLHFVSQANPDIYSIDDVSNLVAKHNLPDKFFYMPNQFWEHKNHMTVVQAVDKLKRAGVDVHLVCTGFSEDIKNSSYNQKLMGEIQSNGLNDNIHVLGMIDYQDVLALFRHSVSVLNPSFFEGWSSSVEEAKSVGKNIILSDIPVHREQSPPGACFFDPVSVDGLAEVLKEKWQSGSMGPDYYLEEEARDILPHRTRTFGANFVSLIYETMEIEKH